jgi:predicted DNA-binding protein
MAKKATEKPGTVGERGAGPNPVIRAVVTRQLLTRLEKQAKAEGHTVSSYVRHVIERAVEQIERAVEQSEEIERWVARGKKPSEDEFFSSLHKRIDQAKEQLQKEQLQKEQLQKEQLQKEQLRKRQGRTK